MCLAKVTKRHRQRDDKIIWVYHMFEKKRGKLYALYPHMGKTYEYRMNDIMVSNGRMRTVDFEDSQQRYIAHFHSFLHENEAREYFDTFREERGEYQLRKVRAYELTVEGVQQGYEVIVHRKMYIPRGGQYIVCSQ